MPVTDWINFKENWLIFLGTWGEAELILGIWGAKEKYFQGAEVLSFREFGRSMHYFQGSREQGGGGLSIVMQALLCMRHVEIEQE